MKYIFTQFKLGKTNKTLSLNGKRTYGRIIDIYGPNRQKDNRQTKGRQQKADSISGRHPQKCVFVCSIVSNN